MIDRGVQGPLSIGGGARVEERVARRHYTEIRVHRRFLVGDHGEGQTGCVSTQFLRHRVEQHDFADATAREFSVTLYKRVQVQAAYRVAGESSEL